jgi:predicted PolB exonuclease-like 3'-5' exonuclease
MIEKDVYGRFREEGEGESIDDEMKSEFLRNETISQRNPQLSVNAGLGLSYPLYRDLKLYGKIGGAYYFDAKNDFKTIYSDSKIVMDLSIGIRYEFK